MHGVKVRRWDKKCVSRRDWREYNEPLVARGEGITLSKEKFVKTVKEYYEL